MPVRARRARCHLIFEPKCHAPAHGQPSASVVGRSQQLAPRKALLTFASVTPLVLMWGRSALRSAQSHATRSARGVRHSAPLNEFPKCQWEIVIRLRRVRLAFGMTSAELKREGS